MTLDALSAASCSMTPAWRAPWLPLVCFFTILRPSTITELLDGCTSRTLPFLPLSLPVITCTVSSFLIFILTSVYSLRLMLGPQGSLLQDLWSQRYYLHELLLAQLAGNGAEDT